VAVLIVKPRTRQGLIVSAVLRGVGHDENMLGPITVLGMMR
jgi:hypothetical protein